MQKIRNPFVEIPGYRCFGCAPSNEHGLRMEFFLDHDTVVSEWDPRDYFQGYGNILHGGIQAALMDEIASWAIFVLAETAGMTSGMEIRYRKPVKTDEGKITLKSRLGERKRNIVTVDTLLYDASGEVGSESKVHYFTLKQEDAKRKLYYPGIEAFRAV